MQLSLYFSHSQFCLIYVTMKTAVVSCWTVKCAVSLYPYYWKFYTYYTEMTAFAVKCNNKLKCFTVSQSVHACCYIVARSQLHQLVYSSFPHVTVLCLLNSMAVLFVSNNCHSCTSTVSCPQCIKQFHHHTYWVQCDILMCSCRRIVHQTALLWWPSLYRHCLEKCSIYRIQKCHS